MTEPEPVPDVIRCRWAPVIRRWQAYGNLSCGTHVFEFGGSREEAISRLLDRYPEMTGLAVVD